MRKNKFSGWGMRGSWVLNYCLIRPILVSSSWRQGLMAGLNQLGLSETIAEVISKMPEELRGMYWANIGILGGLGYVEALGERL
jgi:actin-related protein